MGNKPSGPTPQFQTEDEALEYYQKHAKQNNLPPPDKDQIRAEFHKAQQERAKTDAKTDKTDKNDSKNDSKSDKIDRSSSNLGPKSPQQQSSQQTQQQQAQPQDIQQSNSNPTPTTTTEDGVVMTTTSNPLHSANRKVTMDDFDLMAVIGKGSFGKVFSVRKKDTGKIYAMKVLKKEEILRKKQVAHTQAERRILENIEHPFIVSLRYAFQSPEKLYFVLDLFTGGELFFHLKTYGRFTEQMTVFYAAQLVLALDCLHSHNIIYRDLKPENILLDDDGNIRLTDFGLSKEIKNDPTEIMTICGTPEYLSPEVISHQGDAASLRYTKAVDYWALGTLIYEMLVGLPPFFNNNVMQMYQRILSSPLEFPPGIMSLEAQDFITQLLNRDPNQRLGSGPNGIQQIQAHPWFQIFGLDFGYLLRKQIVPPFRPSSDQLNIDDEFQMEPVADTPCQAGNVKGRVKFPQFSYQAPSEGLGGNGGF